MLYAWENYDMQARMPIENSNFYASLLGVYPCTKSLRQIILVVDCIIKNVQVRGYSGKWGNQENAISHGLSKYK